MIRILVTGGGGQLADAMVRASDSAESASYDLISLGKAELDVTRVDDVRRSLEEFEPDVIVNAAAYTNVDAAETDFESAMVVNGKAVGIIAEQAKEIGARFIQISTDFVFEGRTPVPIRTDATMNPISAYGVSKQRGEELCTQILGDRSTIIRTSWLYGSGHRNFVSTMLRLMSTREEIGVVADQIGTPTWSMTLAESILTMIGREIYGTHHVSDSGIASWFDFAVAISDLGGRAGILSNACRIRPISTDDFPVAAKRPRYSVLEKAGTWASLERVAPHWTHSLSRCLNDWKGPSI